MRIRTVVPALLLLSFLWLNPSSALPQNLGPWRALTTEEEKARIGKKPSNEADPSMIEAEFDGDKAKDTALIAVRTTDGARGLVVVLKNHIHVLVLSGENRTGIHADKSPLLEAGIRIAEPGSWGPNCFDDACFKDRPKKRVLKNPGILFYEGPNTVLYYWEPRTKRFTGSLMVD